MYFHSSQAIMEHPAILVKAFHARGIHFRFDDTLLRAIGNVDEFDVRLVLKPKRHRGNLATDVGTLPGTAERTTALFTELKDLADASSHEWESKCNEVLRVFLEEHERRSAVADRIAAVLAEQGILSVHSSLEVEFDAATARYPASTVIQDTIREIREEEQMVTCSVSAQKFEDAEYHANERERLLDSLYDLCTP